MKVGRPRSFEEDQALDKALEVFWEHGYEGASLPALTKAMGINRPSLYAAFGNKEALFKRALERYGQGPASYVTKALEAPTGRKALEGVLLGAAEMLGDPTHPPGCLGLGALSCGSDAEGARQALVAFRKAGEAAIRRRLERAVADGDLAKSVDPADLARYVVAVVHGMCVQAINGAKPKELRRVAELALQAVPGRK